MFYISRQAVYNCESLKIYHANTCSTHRAGVRCNHIRTHFVRKKLGYICISDVPSIGMVLIGIGAGQTLERHISSATIDAMSIRTTIGNLRKGRFQCTQPIC
eukprot:3378477-Amphidinium_carterae.1